MKKLLLILLLSLSLFADFKIASWNLKNVSMNSLMFKKSIFKINKYISTKKDFDVICLQELRDKKIIYFLSGGIKEIFFSPFSRITSKYKGKGRHKEVYGFLVNKKYKNIKEVEFNNYRSFKRPPMAIILDGKIAVVNIHIVYGKTVKVRKKEVKALNGIIRTLNKKYHIARKNIFIVGDFNLTAKNMRKIHKTKEIWIDAKTTLGRKNFSKNYDHFITMGRTGTVRARQDFVDNFRFFQKNLSDHIPIEGSFR